MNTHPLELQWIHHIHDALRSKPMDLFFIGWNFVDTFAFSSLLILIVWYLIDRKLGIKLLFILILSGVFNQFFKKAFGMPRPCHIDPTVAVLCFDSPGFPSGAAQTAILLAGIMWIECQKRLYRILGIIFALFLCFSRIYLGLHYFTDILGGLTFGGLLLLTYWKVFPLAEKRWKIYLPLFLVFLLIISPYSRPFFFWETLGIAIGLFAYERQKTHSSQTWPLRLTTFFVVLIGFFLINLGTGIVLKMKYPLTLLAGFWISFLGAWIVQRLNSNSKSGH